MAKAILGPTGWAQLVKMADV